MSGIDYSKWDKLEVSSDEESGKLGSGCRVTRFESPQSITIGGGGEGGESVVANSSLPAEAKTESGYVSRERAISLEDYVLGGRSVSGRDYYWSQADDSLALLLEIGQEMQNKDFVVTVTEDNITIRYRSETVLSEEFEYGVNDDDGTVFWSIKEVEVPNKTDNSKTMKRMLALELEKKKLDASIRLWWKRIFKGGIETDITKSGRFSSSKMEERNKRFIQAWEEAHSEFKSRIKDRQKITI
ncbi:Low complexity protein [Cryptosporidium canis]|nr:Low complexity protein [Cryptosporidium canis]